MHATMHRVARACSLGLVAIAASAHAQVATDGITIIVEDAELRPGESTTIRMEAYFDDDFYAMAGVATSLFSSTGPLGLSDPRVLAPMDGPGTTPGMIDDDGVLGIVAGQLNFPATGAIFADPTNPMPFWEVTYTAPSDVTIPFEVSLDSRTSRFDVYVARDSSRSESRLGLILEDEAVIRVVPAPAGALALLGLLGVTRRRPRHG